MFFRDPVLLLILPLCVFLFFLRRKKYRTAGIRFSSSDFFKKTGYSLRIKLSGRLIWLRIAAVFLLVFALARPQAPVADSKVRTEGIDIVLAIDCSTSMLARDFELNGERVDRLTVVKNVVRRFIEERGNDRIGIIAFAGRAYTVCPLTLDGSWLIRNLDRIEAGMLEDGTAIGSGIASSLNRLKDAEAKGKAVVLLTDGVNNAGEISPLTAAEAAKALAIKVYTIGVGTEGPVPYPVRDFLGNTVYQQVEIKIDENMLKKIASVTDAKYYRATDTESLRKIYQEIDKLETSPVEERGYSDYRELFFVFLLPALLLLFLESLLGNTLLRVNP